MLVSCQIFHFLLVEKFLSLSSHFRSLLVKTSLLEFEILGGFVLSAFVNYFLFNVFNLGVDSG